jgi:hypothetical protein
MARSPGTTDFRDLKNAKTGEKANDDRPDTNPQRRWWTMKGEKCAMAVRDVVDSLQKAQKARMDRARTSAVLYGNLGASGMWGATPFIQGQTGSRTAVTYNAVQSNIDTLTSRIGETKPRPYFLTSGGDYKQQRKAKKLNQFVEGVFYETKTYDLGLEAFRDGSIFGDGFVHAFIRGKRIVHEVVSCTELWLDEEEGKYGKPRNMHRQQVVDKDQLIGIFPKSADEIAKASRAPGASASQSASVSDMVTVVTSWHLGDMQEDGKLKGGKFSMALVAGGHMLVEPEDWPYDFFPFARFSWCKRPTGQGYWSQGLAEQLQAQQIELNRQMALRQRSMHMMGSFKVLIKNGSKIVKEHLNNEVGAVITHNGDPPQYVTPNPLPEVYFRSPRELIEDMRSQCGNSEVSTEGKKPAGLNSGVAIRNFQDIESDRQRTPQRANDNLYLQLAYMDICLARELGDYKVRVPSKVAFNTIDFKKDIGDLKDTEYVMQCFPVSRLPKDPAGRLQTVQEYIEAGIIEPRHGRRLLDFPDIDSIESLANAQEDIITKVLDDIIDDGKYHPPEPTDDLKLAKEMVLEFIQRYRLLDLEDDKLDMLRSWNAQVDEMMSAMLAPLAAAPMGAPGGEPGQPQGGPQLGQPAAPPTSELMPRAA